MSNLIARNFETRIELNLEQSLESCEWKELNSFKITNCFKMLRQCLEVMVEVHVTRIDYKQKAEEHMYLIYLS